MIKMKKIPLWEKILLAVTAVTLIVAIVLMIVVLPTSVNANKYNKLYQPTAYSREIEATNAIYFLGVDSGDCIVLSSEGRLAVIDCAEDSDNPRGFESLDHPGDENNICGFLKDNFSDENGNLYIDFIVGTHSHSDHIGGFDTLISDENITIGKAYLKRYLPDTIRKYEKEKWDNQEVYDQTVNALTMRGVECEQDIFAQTSLGQMEISFYNTEYDLRTDLGENDNSLALLVTCCGKKALLMGDVNNDSGDEIKIAQAVGKVDLLKIGHHGLTGSTTKNFVSLVRPAVSIVTNKRDYMDQTVKRSLYRTGSAIFSSEDEQGIMAVLQENENIKLYNLCNA